MKKELTAAEALQKLRHYCAYQERCHSEVSQKLRQLGIAAGEHAPIIASLIEDNYLDEERFAIQFAGGRFRMKHWGRRKIEHALQQKQVSAYSIGRALKSIPEQDYLGKLHMLADQKYTALNDTPVHTRKNLTVSYLLYKGYEPKLATEAAETAAIRHKGLHGETV
ncbi:MAG TPA: regulatory protein RecX [Flavisolibacter sp.]